MPKAEVIVPLTHTNPTHTPHQKTTTTKTHNPITAQKRGKRRMSTKTSPTETKQVENARLKVKRSRDTAHVLRQSAQVPIQEAVDDGLADVGSGAMADIGWGVEKALEHLLLGAVLQVPVLLERLVGFADDLHGKWAGGEQLVAKSNN